MTVPQTSRIRISEKEDLLVTGIRLEHWRCAVTLLISLLTFGLPVVLLAWRRDWKMAVLYRHCPLREAKRVVIEDSFKELFEEDVIEVVQNGHHADVILPYSRYFTNKKMKYIWDESILQFVKLSTFDEDKTCDVFHSNPDGLESATVNQMSQIYGVNLIEIVVLPLWKLTVKEVSNPFYLMQLYTVTVWLIQEFYDYSIMVIVATVISVGTSVWETRKQTIALREQVHVSGALINVTRGGTVLQILTKHLVPGDVICIDPCKSQMLHCDAVLVEGSCSVDESMLTGESYPITKIAASSGRVPFNFAKHKRHVLFCGTQLLQGRSQTGQTYLKAVVVRTGFMTTKGELIRAIIFPKPMSFRFYQDLIQVVMLFFFFALGGMIYTFTTWLQHGATTKQIILHSLDIVTFVVPPFLPAALTAAQSFARNRLKKKKIFCLSSKHISQCGGVDLVCFDKTGTLTDTEVDIAGAVPVRESEFRDPLRDLTTLPQNHPFLLAIASCHSLIRIKDKLSGYSVDQKMFEATEWDFKEGPTGVNSEYGIETPFLVSAPSWNDKREINSASTTEVAVLKRFPFESNVKRMTVVTQRRGFDHFTVFIKGAPELIASLCDPFTIPPNFESVLKHYTTQGYRVLALAQKVLSPHLTWTHVAKLNREELEHQSELIGLLVVRNQLKVETIPTLRVLHEAQIGTVMVTGDNLQTAVTVAKECVMIDPLLRLIQVEASLITASAEKRKQLQVIFKDPLSTPKFINPFNRSMEGLVDVHSGSYCFVLDGNTFECLRSYNPPLLERIVHRAKVFARMAPEDKQHLIEILQKIGHQVAMVGDGCNDCGALRTADAGISLSMADASVAAPFTSQETNISCVIPVLLEGRTTLESVFATFLYACGVNFASFIGVLMLSSISTEPTDFQYLIWDLAICSLPFFTIGNAKPTKYLHSRRPLRHLWALLPMFSFFSFLFWQVMVFITAWFFCIHQSWFEEFRFEPGKFPPNPCYQETTIFHLMCISSISGALVFVPGQPYSRSMFRNKLFTAGVAAAITVVLCLMFIDDPALEEWMNFKNPPNVEFNVYILMLGITGGVTCYIWEKLFIRQFLHQMMWPRLNERRPTRHAYQKIEKQLIAQPDWPRMGEPIITDAVGQFSNLKDQEKIPLFKIRTNLRTLARSGKTTVDGPAFPNRVAMSTLAAADELSSVVVVENEKGPDDGNFPLPPSEIELLILAPPPLSPDE